MLNVKIILSILYESKLIIDNFFYGLGGNFKLFLGNIDLYRFILDFLNKQI